MINNLVYLYGRMTADPELTMSQDNVMFCNFYVAVPQPYVKDHESDTDFIKVKTSGKKAKFVRDNFRKGKPICVTGSIRTNKWTDKDGKHRNDFYVQAQKVDFGIESNLPKKEKLFSVPEKSDFEEVDFDLDDLPY